MGNIIRFPPGSSGRFGFERVRSTYTVREICQQFGLDERHIRRWTREGLIRTAAGSTPGELRYDLSALRQFRRFRELRAKGLTPRQIYAELRGQLNLFSEPGGQLVALPRRRTPFEEALGLDESSDPRTPEAYRTAIREGDCAADAHCNLGIWEFEAGRVSGAFDGFTQALKLDPRHFESHFNLGNLYFELGDNALARVHYELAAEIEPSFPNVYFNLALALALQENFAAALESLRRFRALADAAQAGKSDELVAMLERVLEQSG